MKKNEEMIWVTVYADSTGGLFSEFECDCDNLVELQFPRWIVEEYYKQNEDDFVGETSDELDIPEEECTFDLWLKSVYTAEDTDELYSFAEEKGFSAKCGIDTPNAVFYRDDCNYKYIVFEGTEDECRQFCKENEWEWNGEELELLN